MRAAIYLAAVAAITGSAEGAKDSLTHAVLRFTNKSLVKVREDPIVSPGTVGKHVHNVMGGSAFGKSVTGEELMNSECTNAQIVGDMSSYWFPSLYFRDPESHALEDVEISYVNVYYFFEPTDDDLEPFPIGLKILGGDPSTRTAPKGGAKTNIDPSKGPIQPVKFTCPRLGNSYSPASWPVDSDGSKAGMQDPDNPSEGCGFPDVTCDGLASPLRADIHMPSCYNPDKGLDDHQHNMAWPSDNGNGKVNCPTGHIHVPHLFFEIYWNTPAFQGRWIEGQGRQPFVLSNGDATGFSSHADFLAAWDQDILRHIISTCNSSPESNGMGQCSGLEINTRDCTIEPGIDERTTGRMNVLPGNNPILGWAFGLGGVKDPATDVDAFLLSGSSFEESTPGSASRIPPGAEALAVERRASDVVDSPTKSQATAVAGEPPNDVEELVKKRESKTSSDSKDIHEVWHTIDYTERVYPEPTGAALARHYLHGHGRSHGRRNLH